MFFKRRSNVLYRDYVSFGYITDGSIFGYNKLKSSYVYSGSKILSQSGSLFFSALTINPRHINELIRDIRFVYADVDESTLISDAREFYLELEQNGFVVSGDTPNECEENDPKFSYKTSFPNNRTRDFHSASEISKQTTFDFLDDYFGGEPQLSSVHIDITSKCNERCIHCYIPHENKVNSMEPSLFYRILDQCKNMRLLHLTLSGGEPMLHNEFINFLRRCREYNFSVSLLSNLTLLDGKIISEMKENSLLGVQVSLYSMEPDIHDMITNSKGSFSKTISGILKLIENDIPLQISCPIIKQNIGHYRDVVKWAENHNIRAASDYVVIGAYNSSIENIRCRLSLDDVRNVVLDKSTSDHSYIENLEAEFRSKKSESPDDSVCSVCTSSICIAEGGSVYPCAGWQSYIVGNVKETSLEEIWNNSNEIRFLRGLRKRDFPKCTQCADRDICTMCMVRNANEEPHGNPLVVSEYFCKVANLNKRILLEKPAT